MRTITMHRLQDLVRLHRLGNGAREVARLLEMMSASKLFDGTAIELIDVSVSRAPPPDRLSGGPQWINPAELALDFKKWGSAIFGTPILAITSAELSTISPADL